METIIGKLSRMGPVKRGLILIGVVLIVYAATAPLDILGIPRVGAMLRGVAGAGAAVLAFRSASDAWRERNDPRTKWPLPGRRWGLVGILLVWLAFVVFAGKSFPASVTETANATVILCLFALALRGPMDPDVDDTEQVATWEWHNPLKTIRRRNPKGGSEQPAEARPAKRGLFRGGRTKTAASTEVNQVNEVLALAQDNPEQAAQMMAEDTDLAKRLTQEYPELSSSLMMVWRAGTEGVPGFDDDEFYETDELEELEEPVEVPLPSEEGLSDVGDLGDGLDENVQDQGEVLDDAEEGFYDDPSGVEVIDGPSWVEQDTRGT